METVKVQWQSSAGQWLVSPLQDNQWQPLAEWADQQPDLTPVRMVLSAINYSTHWVSLPGVSARQLGKALPFALEEALIEDVSHYLIVPAGQAAKKVRAYALTAELIERLLEECEMHHLQLRELIPQTQLVEAGNVFLRRDQDGISGWIISLPGRFEGWVPDAGMTAVLDSLFDEAQGDAAELVILAPQLDQAQLLKTTLETSFPEVFSQIECRPQDGLATAEQRLNSRPVNLLTGQFQVRDVAQEKPPVWWRPLAAMAAVWLIAATGWLFIEQHNTSRKAAQVTSETIALYKKLFPGERVREAILNRQIQGKLSGGGEVAAGGFLTTTNTLARVYAAQGLQKQVQLMSLRYNDRIDELTLEVRAGNLNELQTLRQALENEGLAAEVASATNDKEGVKGRIRIGGSA